jgi:2-succinyl-5-enolpyruvyl-6-hydroxy-3-cyclohexene-1-carboxylate synthase
MACGLAEESEEPVVLSCTGATASRNYIPGLTEAYYRHLPVLAITSTQHTGRIGHYYAQVIDRSVTFPDVVKKSIQLPSVFSEEDRQYTITAVNDGLLELVHREKGPVHFNLTTVYSAQFTTEELPKCRVIHRIMTDEFPKIPVGKIGIYVGAHEAFSPELTAAIDAFCEANNAVVICDQISNYRGKYRFLASLVNNQEKEFGTRSDNIYWFCAWNISEICWRTAVASESGW